MACIAHSHAAEYPLCKLRIVIACTVYRVASECTHLLLYTISNQYHACESEQFWSTDYGCNRYSSLWHYECNHYNYYPKFPAFVLPVNI